MRHVEELAVRLYEDAERGDTGRGADPVPWTQRPEIVKDAWRSVARRQTQTPGAAPG